MAIEGGLCSLCGRTATTKIVLGDGSEYFNLTAAEAYLPLPTSTTNAILFRTRPGAWVLLTIDEMGDHYKRVTQDEAAEWQFKHRGGPQPCKEI